MLLRRPFIVRGTSFKGEGCFKGPLAGSTYSAPSVELGWARDGQHSAATVGRKALRVAIDRKLRQHCHPPPTAGGPALFGHTDRKDKAGPP